MPIMHMSSSKRWKCHCRVRSVPTGPRWGKLACSGQWVLGKFGDGQLRQGKSVLDQGNELGIHSFRYGDLD